MWDWHWQSADYGLRYDYGVVEVHPMILERFRKYNCREPTKGWLASDLRHPRYRTVTVPVIVKHGSVRKTLHKRERVAYLPKCELPPNTGSVDFRPLAERYRPIIGGVGETGRWELTRGAVAGCWAVSKSGPGDVVVMVACDNMHGGITLPLDAAFSKAYQNDFSGPRFHDYFGGVTKTGNHDFHAERRLLEHMADERGVTVMFAQDCW
jgi:hypothetical protein